MKQPRTLGNGSQGSVCSMAVPVVGFTGFRPLLAILGTLCTPEPHLTGALTLRQALLPIADISLPERDLSELTLLPDSAPHS